MVGPQQHYYLRPAVRCGRQVTVGRHRAGEYIAGMGADQAQKLASGSWARRSYLRKDTRAQRPGETAFYLASEGGKGRRVKGSGHRWLPDLSPGLHGPLPRVLPDVVLEPPAPARMT